MKTGGIACKDVSWDLYLTKVRTLVLPVFVYDGLWSHHCGDVFNVARACGQS